MLEIAYLGIISFFSAFTSWYLTKYLIPFFEKNNIIALDLHKRKKTKLANSGGIAVCLSLVMGLMFFIATQTFVFKSIEEMANQIVYLFASILTILLITIIGFFDDLNSSDVVRGARKIRKGLKKWQKPLFTLPAAIPLMVVSAGVTSMSIPFIGPVDFGLLYPVFLIPIIVVFAANAINLLG